MFFFLQFQIDWEFRLLISEETKKINNKLNPHLILFS